MIKEVKIKFFITHLIHFEIQNPKLSQNYY